jgi:hypothetical protein
MICDIWYDIWNGMIYVIYDLWYGMVWYNIWNDIICDIWYGMIWYMKWYMICDIWYMTWYMIYLVYDMIYDMIHLLTAIELTHCGSSTVQFTHKQYSEQCNEAEYTEKNMHNNKST